MENNEKLNNINQEVDLSTMLNYITHSKIVNDAENIDFDRLFKWELFESFVKTMVYDSIVELYETGQINLNTNFKYPCQYFISNVGDYGSRTMIINSTYNIDGLPKMTIEIRRCYYTYNVN